MEWVKKHKVLTAIIAFVVLIGAAGASSSDTSNDQSNNKGTSTDTSRTEATDDDTAKQQVNEAEKVEAEPEKPTETVSQKNAVNKAKSYLDFAGFSRDGLVAQLEFDKFSSADAVYGADNAGADWNVEAEQKARSYMEFSSFSRQGLIDQLVFDKFTQAQATHGADSVGL